MLQQHSDQKELNGSLEYEKLGSRLKISRFKTDLLLADYAPFVTACFFEMTFSSVLWTDVLMMHEMCRLAVLVLFQCAVPASELVIGAFMSYLWDSSCLFKDRGPFILFTWEQVSKCQIQWFIFHVRIEMSHSSIIPSLTKCHGGNILHVRRNLSHLKVVSSNKNRQRMWVSSPTWLPKGWGPKWKSFLLI